MFRFVWPQKYSELKVFLFTVWMIIQAGLIGLISGNERYKPFNDLSIGQNSIALNNTKTYPGACYKEVKAFADGTFLVACSEGFLMIVDDKGICFLQLRAPYDEVAVQENSIALKEGNTIYLYSKQGVLMEERPFARGFFAFGPQISCTANNTTLSIKNTDATSNLCVNGQIVSSVYFKGLKSKPLPWFLFCYHMVVLLTFAAVFIIKNRHLLSDMKNFHFWSKNRQYSD